MDTQSILFHLPSYFFASFLSKCLGSDSLPPLRDLPPHEKTDLAAYSYNLLPVWLMTYNFNGELIPFAINGQTGKAYGQLPVSTGKLAAFCAIVAVLIFILGVLGGMLFI